MKDVDLFNPSISVNLFAVADAMNGNGVLGFVEEHAVIADAEAK